MATTFTGLMPVQVFLSQMTPNDFFAHNTGDASSLAMEGTALVPSLGNLSASTPALNTIKIGQRGQNANGQYNGTSSRNSSKYRRPTELVRETVQSTDGQRN